MQYRLAELSPFPGSQATLEWGLEVQCVETGGGERRERKARSPAPLGCCGHPGAGGSSLV